MPAALPLPVARCSRRPTRPWRCHLPLACLHPACGAAARLLDGGGCVRMFFPGLVALATAAMLAFALWSPARYVLTVSGAGDARVATRVPRRVLDEAEGFADAVMAASDGARRGAGEP